jgi:hypothetical protein
MAAVMRCVAAAELHILCNTAHSRQLAVVSLRCLLRLPASTPAARLLRDFMLFTVVRSACPVALQGSCSEVAAGSSMLQTLPARARHAGNMPASHARAAVTAPTRAVCAAKFNGRQAA